MEVPPARAPGRPALEQLRPGEREHEDRIVARPLQQVLHEVEQRRVGPVQILEKEDDGCLGGHQLEEPPPRGEEILLVGRSPLRKTEEVGEPRLDPAALVRIGYVFFDRYAELRPCGLGGLVLENPRSHPHHLRQRPVGDALAVGEAATCVPPDVVDQAVRVLVELPAEPRLPDPGNADHRDGPGLALVSGCVECLPHEPQLDISPDERRLQTCEPLATAQTRRDPQRPPQVDRPGLSLQLALSGVLIRDRGVGHPQRRLTDKDASGCGLGLDARRRVDEVSGDHPLTLGADGNCRFPCDDSGAQPEFREPRLGSEGGDLADQVEGCPHGALGVVLLRDRSAPDRHHRIADELLDGPAVAADDTPGRVEVA